MKNPKLFSLGIALSALALLIMAISNSLVFEETVKVEPNALGAFCMLLLAVQLVVILFWKKQIKKV